MGAPTEPRHPGAHAVRPRPAWAWACAALFALASLAAASAAHADADADAHADALEPRSPWETQLLRALVLEARGGARVGAGGPAQPDTLVAGAAAGRLTLLEIDQQGLDAQLLRAGFGFASEPSAWHSELALLTLDGWFCGRGQRGGLRCQELLGGQPAPRAQWFGLGGELLRHQYASEVDVHQLRLAQLFATWSLTDPFTLRFLRLRLQLLAGASADRVWFPGRKQLAWRGSFGLLARFQGSRPALRLQLRLVYQPLLNDPLPSGGGLPNATNRHGALGQLRLSLWLAARLRGFVQLRYDYNGVPALAWGPLTSTTRNHSAAATLGLELQALGVM